MLTDEQVITGKMYSYHQDGDEKMGVLEIVTKEIKGVRWCRFDNGDQISLTAFKTQAINVEGQELETNHVPQTTNESVVIPTMDVKIDKGGNPILGTNNGEGGSEDYSDIVATPREFKKSQTINDPVIKLLEKANTKEEMLSIEIPAKLINKKLFSVIVESFGEESKKTICDFVMDNIPQKHFKDALMKMIEEHYGEPEE